MDIENAEKEKKEKRLAILAKAREAAQAKRREIGNIAKEEKLNKEKERLLRQAENKRKSDELDAKLKTFQRKEKSSKKKSKSKKKVVVESSSESDSEVESDSESDVEEDVETKVKRKGKKKAMKHRDGVLRETLDAELENEKWRVLAAQVAGRTILTISVFPETKPPADFRLPLQNYINI